MTSDFNKLYSSIYHNYNKPNENALDFNFPILESQKLIISPQKYQSNLTDSANKGSNNSANYTYLSEEQKLVIKECLSELQLSKIKASPIIDIKLDLKNQNLQDPDAEKISNMLKQLCNKSIKYFKLNLSKNQNLGDKGILNILQGCSRFTQLEKLIIYLDYCNISDNTIRQMADQFRQFQNLKTIDVSIDSTIITEAAVSYFFQAFQNSGIETDVKCNNYPNIQALKKQNLNNAQKKKFFPQAAKNFMNYSFNSNNTNNNYNNNNNNNNNQKISDQQQEGFGEMMGEKDSNLNSFHIAKKLQSNSDLMYQKNQFEDEEQFKTPQVQQAEKKMEQEYGKGFLLLQNLGYKVGNGLGKNKDGIIEPIKATNKRKFKEAIKNKQKNFNQSGDHYFLQLAQNQHQIQGNQNHFSTLLKQSSLIKFEKREVLEFGNKSPENEIENEEVIQEQNEEIIFEENAAQQQQKQAAENKQQQQKQQQQQCNVNSNQNFPINNNRANNFSQDSNNSANSTLIFNTVFNLNLNNQNTTNQLNQQTNINNGQFENNSASKKSSNNNNISTSANKQKESENDKNSDNVPQNSYQIKQSPNFNDANKNIAKSPKEANTFQQQQQQQQQQKQINPILLLQQQHQKLNNQLGYNNINLSNDNMQQSSLSKNLFQMATQGNPFQSALHSQQNQTLIQQQETSDKSQSYTYKQYQKQIIMNSQQAKQFNPQQFPR